MVINNHLQVCIAVREFCKQCCDRYRGTSAQNQAPGPTQPEPALCGRLERLSGKSWGSKQAHHVIHQLVSVVSHCGAGAWLNGLASGDQHQLTGSGSALAACSRRCAIQTYRFFTLILYFYRNIYLYVHCR